MSRKPRKNEEDNGFAAWGGYMEAKKAKLAEQFSKVTVGLTNKKSDIFNGIAILVNGYTKPGADELKIFMAAHGGNYHLYQNQGGCPTTHIIATNLPNTKINQLGNVPVVSPEWIVDSISANKLLDFKKYLLYTNHSRTQPKLNFPAMGKDKNAVPSPEQPQKYAKTATDPQFLSDFYNNSRLHLISTLGAEFKQLVNKLREESNSQFPGLDKLIQSKSDAGITTETPLKSEKIIMHIDMDCFFVSVGLRNRPELRGKPIAVTHSKSGKSNPNGSNRQAEVDLYMKRLPSGVIPKLDLIDETSSMAEIASCSYEARRCGVRNGMFMGSALKICPDLVPIPYDFEGYKQVSSILYHTIAEYTLDIEAVSCDEMYVDVTKILKKSGITVVEWASHIRHEIMERTGCPCSTGFGANRLQARLATKKAKPNGQYYLEPEEVDNYMYDLPLEDLPGVGYATIIKLHNLGLKTCGDLYDISLSTLKNELGQKNSEMIYDQARGIDKKSLNYEHERKSVSADVNYGIRFKNHSEALVFLESLSNEVYNRLSEIKMKAKTITLKLLTRAEGAPKETAKYLGCGVCDAINKSITTSYYLENPQHIFKEAKNLYERLSIIPEDLRGVGIQLSKLEKIAKTNKALAKFLNQPSNVGSNLTDRNESFDNSIGGIQDNNVKISHNKNTNFTTMEKTVTQDIKSSSKQDKVTGTVSKRGRSRGNMNTLKATSNLTNYFKHTKNESATKEFKSGNNSIDLNVLKELPKDIQKEIMEEYNLFDTAFDKLENKTASDNTNEKQNLTTKDNKNNENQELKKKGFASLSKEELKILLKNWIRNQEIPKDRDVDMLGTFFTNLVQERKLEYLFSMVNLLYRHISTKNCQWHDAYYKLLNHFQEAMLLTYGNTLLVPKGFFCGQHN
ncbi:BRCA1 C Terminus (BRCT) domain [Popillia japonica]|uniref:DNA repair protein REV1 n=1 Tax=Popillia japonica TaxID=7064 RepID=A0AAW1JH78_POPJA